MPPINLATFQVAVGRDLCRLAPTRARIEFPPVTQPAPLTIGESRAWYGMYERGHVQGTRDEYERAAAEAIVDAYARWQDEKQAAWPGWLAPAVWKPDDLELWAGWLRGLPENERYRWEDRLASEEGWWAELNRREEAWWEARNRAQGDWLERVLEASRAHRKKGFLGHLQEPDAAWQSWLDMQGQDQLQAQESAWLEHGEAVRRLVQGDALKTAFYQAVRADVEAQVHELAALAPEDHAYWAGRVHAWGMDARYGDWREFQDAWARLGARQAEELLRRPDVRPRACEAVRHGGPDAPAFERTLTPVLAGLAGAGVNVPMVPLLCASAAVYVARLGAAVFCGASL